jgi:hypothetical protein
MDADLHGPQGGTLQPRPDVMPRQVPPDPLHQRGGESAGQLLVDGRRCGQLQVGRVHTGQGEDLTEEGEEVSILGRRVTLHLEANRGQDREEVLEADS